MKKINLYLKRKDKIQQQDKQYINVQLRQKNKKQLSCVHNSIFMGVV